MRDVEKADCQDPHTGCRSVPATPSMCSIHALGVMLFWAAMLTCISAFSSSSFAPSSKHAAASLYRQQVAPVPHVAMMAGGPSSAGSTKKRRRRKQGEISTPDAASSSSSSSSSSSTSKPQQSDAGAAAGEAEALSDMQMSRDTSYNPDLAKLFVDDWSGMQAPPQMQNKAAQERKAKQQQQGKACKCSLGGSMKMWTRCSAQTQHHQ